MEMVGALRREEGHGKIPGGSYGVNCAPLKDILHPNPKTL